MKLYETTGYNWDLTFSFIFPDPYTKAIMKEFYNTDPEFAEFKYAYSKPKSSKDVADLLFSTLLY